MENSYLGTVDELRAVSVYRLTVNKWQISSDYIRSDVKQDEYLAERGVSPVAYQ